MATPKHFLTLAETFLKAQEPLAAGLYAESALVQITHHSANHGTNHSIKSAETNGAVHEHLDMFVKQLFKPLPYYSGLIAQAKQLALETRKSAHAPFSNFLVGATLIADDESLHIGCNVECSSYGLTICAERTALVSAVAQGKKRFLAVVVAVDTDEPTPPCGACRQMLYDFAPDAVVILLNLQGAEKRFTMKDLLPEAFSAAFL